MSEEILHKLLKHIHSDPATLEEWLENPQEKTKEWEYNIEEKTISTLSSTLKFMIYEIQQVKEVRYMNQRSVKKMNEASKHSKWLLYATLGVNITTFLIGVIMLFIGIYAAFQDKIILGTIIGLASSIAIVYFLIAKPLQQLTENVGNIVQMEIALGSWFNEMTYWQVFLKDSDIEGKQAVAQAIRDSAKWTIMLIEDYCSASKEKTNITEKSQEILAKTRTIFEKLGIWKENDKKLLPLSDEKDYT